MNPTGIVFDIQKFSLNDGPGIRTVVFLKGCPLRCVWCCNPESQAASAQLGYLAEKCTHCLDCVSACERNALQQRDGRLDVSLLHCNGCGDCIAYCPENALKIYGRETTTEAVLEEVLKDTSFYKNSGGGMTLSGGEPMQQFDFSLALLGGAKANDIHTCMETSGYASTENFRRIMPLVDLFLYDYKLTDPVEHERYTGVDNKVIIQNLHFLHDAGKDIVVRCILIPGINDNEQHFNAIANLEQRLPNLRGIELMPYHEFGKNKYETTGKKPFEPGISTVEDDQVDLWLDTLKSMGCEKVKRG
jgi:pyruvate formate lyase activating enzyme